MLFVLSLTIKWLFVEFAGERVQVILDPCRLYFLHNTVLEEKSIRVSAHCLCVPVYQTPDLIKELAVAPDKVEVVDEFLHYAVCRAFLPRWQDVLASYFHL